MCFLDVDTEIYNSIKMMSKVGVRGSFCDQSYLFSYSIRICSLWGMEQCTINSVFLCLITGCSFLNFISCFNNDSGSN